MCDKNPKQEKRKEMPKKPMSAYFLFCSDKRKENKDKKISPKELGEMYDHLPKSEKERYKKIHEELMKKYEEEMALFMSNNLEDEEKKIKEEKEKEDIKIPETENSDKNLKRKENKDKKISPKELSEMYDHLPESEKERYKKIHEELMKKYEAEMALFMSNNLEDEEKDIKKAKAKSLKSDQKNNNKNACNCGNCDECLKINKK